MIKKKESEYEIKARRGGQSLAFRLNRYLPDNKTLIVSLWRPSIFVLLGWRTDIHNVRYIIMFTLSLTRPHYSFEEGWVTSEQLLKLADDLEKEIERRKAEKARR